jgi:hypothetical protein
VIWIALVLVALLGLLTVAERSWPGRGASPRARLGSGGPLPRLDGPAQRTPGRAEVGEG